MNTTIKPSIRLWLSLLTTAVITIVGVSPAHAVPTTDYESVTSCVMGKSTGSIKPDRCGVWSSYNVYHNPDSLVQGFSYISGVLFNKGNANAKINRAKLEYLDSDGNVLETQNKTLNSSNEFAQNRTLIVNDWTPYQFLLLHSTSIEPTQVRVSFYSVKDNSHKAKWSAISGVTSSCAYGSALGDGMCTTKFKMKNSYSSNKYAQYWIAYFNENGKVVGIYKETTYIKAGAKKSVSSKRAVSPIMPSYTSIRVFGFII